MESQARFRSSSSSGAKARIAATRSRGAGSKEVAKYLEVEGYAKAARLVYAHAVEQSADWSAGERITLTELRQIHHLVVEPAWLHAPPEGLHEREGPGSFSTARHPGSPAG